MTNYSQQSIIILFGTILGAVIGYHLVAAWGFLTLLKQGYYVLDDVLFVCTEPALWFGIPAGSLFGAVTIFFLIRAGMPVRICAIGLVLLSLISLLVLNLLDLRVRPFLVRAASENHLSAVEKIMSYSDLNVNVKDINGRTPLIAASQRGHLKVVQLLLQANADPNMQDEQGLTALMVAVAGNGFKGNIEIIRSLLVAKADVNVKNSQGVTALMIAASIGDKTAVDLLLQSGADINAKDKQGLTSAQKAKQNGHEQIFNLLHPR